MKIYKGSLSTIIGNINLYGNDKFILFVEFNNEQRFNQFSKFFFPFELINKKNELIESAESELKKYFDGKLKIFTTPIKSVFKSHHSLKVIKTLLENVPFGTVISYEGLSKLSCIKNGARFVGNVMSKNNLPIFIPCHRVIRSDGKAGGYSGSTNKKKQLINFERGCIK